MASAYSLKCYSCNAIPSEDNCMTTAICPNNQTFCRVVVIEVHGFSYVTKDCVYTCNNNVYNNDEVSGVAYCCHTDLCNIGGASGGIGGLQATYTILTVALCFLGALLK
ncbi:ly6/PLAUR domain-containing protein 2-like [Pyxicephalus adspersus]|uniref:ly6/PLAUR domain-containing protein 2-like n=1 Tax=Pyxicephalus adspersus TaxID=30357 RepID=UPI003B5BB216